MLSYLVSLNIITVLVHHMFCIYIGNLNSEIIINNWTLFWVIIVSFVFASWHCYWAKGIPYSILVNIFLLL